jgi:biopolymer transport protein ExbD
MASRIRNSTNFVSGLRTRYVPQNRIGQGLLSLSPWIDIVFIVIYYALLHGNFVMQPGVVINLPEEPITGGSEPGITVVVLSIETEKPGVRQDLVLFDDGVYRADDASKMKALKVAIARETEKHPGSPLILQADRGATHGTITRICSIAKDLNIRKVNLATRLVPE